MRLGQLSRKVEIKPSEILSYLKNEFDVELGSHLNTKVDDTLAEKVIENFSTQKKLVSSTPIKEVVTEIPLEPKPSKQKKDKPEIQNEPETEIDIKEEILSIEEMDEDIRLNAAVIKAPKIDLPGPTVIGKIDLPPSLEEQMVEIDGVMMSKADLARRKKEERTARKEARQKTNTRSSKTVRTSRIKSEEQLEQLKRDQEASELAKKIASREKRIAAKKKEEAKAKPVRTTPKKKKKPVKKRVMESEPKVVIPVPKTWYGKLWKWFNT